MSGPGAAADHDPARRAFFGQFARQAVSTAGQVASAAGAIDRAPRTAIASLLGISSPGAAPVTEHAYRSPYRLDGEEIVILDQRVIPDGLVETRARRGADVAVALRSGAARGGALAAQLAAYGLWLTALERAEHDPEARDRELRRTADALTEAAPAARLLRWSVARMGRIRAALGAGASGLEVVAALRAEAEAIAAEVQVAQAGASRALGAHLAALADADPGRAGERPFTILMCGDPGALPGGLLGIGLTALRSLRDEGGQLRLFVAETRPYLDGARLGAWELRQAGLEHTVVADSAVAWLFDHESVDVVLLAADWVARDGSCGAIVGSRALAQLARAARWPACGPRPAVVVSTVSAAFDPGSPDGAAIPLDLRPATDLATHLAARSLAPGAALVPGSDVIPAGTIDALVTEAGVLAAPLTPDLVATATPVGNATRTTP